MIFLITGGSGSGKSALAERVCSALGGNLIYLATMPIWTEEDRKKVERHHMLRTGRGFVTLERQNHLEPLPEAEDTVLLECLSTFTANRIFSGEPCRDWENRLWQELRPLLNRRGHTVIVTAETGGDGAAYPQETEGYREILWGLNRRIAGIADCVAESVCGIPVVLKGKLPC